MAWPIPAAGKIVAVTLRVTKPRHAERDGYRCKMRRYRWWLIVAVGCIIAALALDWLRPGTAVRVTAADAGGRAADLPDITSFQTRPSGRFPVDLADVAAGHPYQGVRAARPHAGAHAHFDNSAGRWPKGGDEPANYPAVYAVADGEISRVDERFRLGKGNDRYGLDLAFAVGPGGATCHFCYSLEPMVAEPSRGFYRRFLHVRRGDRVRKGQVIAHLYTPREARGTHVHFHLRVDGQKGFLAPAIFTPAVARQFHDRWGEFGLDGGARMPPCLGYRLGAAENPFGTGAKDAL